MRLLVSSVHVPVSAGSLEKEPALHEVFRLRKFSVSAGFLEKEPALHNVYLETNASATADRNAGSSMRQPVGHQ